MKQTQRGANQPGRGGERRGEQISTKLSLTMQSMRDAKGKSMGSCCTVAMPLQQTQWGCVVFIRPTRKLTAQKLIVGAFHFFLLWNFCFWDNLKRPGIKIYWHLRVPRTPPTSQNNSFEKAIVRKSSNLSASGQKTFQGTFSNRGYFNIRSLWDTRKCMISVNCWHFPGGPPWSLYWRPLCLCWVFLFFVLRLHTGSKITFRPKQLVCRTHRFDCGGMWLAAAASCRLFWSKRWAAHHFICHLHGKRCNGLELSFCTC